MWQERRTRVGFAGRCRHNPRIRDHEAKTTTRKPRRDTGRGGIVYVDDQRGLDKLVHDLERRAAIAIDTEANSMYAYRERLCLLQISTASKDYVVDPLADIDLGALSGVLADVSIVKLLHGAEYDVLQLKRTGPFEIRGLFDTRVAAASLGFASPGLAAVLERWLGVEVDKTHQRSNWGQRPLTDAQLEYARDDTRYLIELAELLRDELYDAGSPHPEEVAAECRRLEMLVPDPHNNGPSVDDWIRIKGANALDGTGQRVLQELNRYRHRLAAERDRPLFKVLPSDVLLALAKAKPESITELRKVRALAPKLASRHGRELVDVIAHAARRGPLKRAPRSRASPEDALSRDQRVVYEAIRQFRKARAEQRGTDASLILHRQTMIDLARVRPAPTTREQLVATGLLEPWRVALYGDGLGAAIGAAGG